MCHMGAQVIVEPQALLREPPLAAGETALRPRVRA